jgi:hypothetical protein
MISKEKMEEYKKVIAQNKVLVEYIRTHNPTDEELRQLITDIHLFFLKLLTNKELFEAVKEEIYNYLKNIGERIKSMANLEEMLEEALFDGVASCPYWESSMEPDYDVCPHCNNKNPLREEGFI